MNSGVGIPKTVAHRHDHTDMGNNELIAHVAEDHLMEAAPHLLKTDNLAALHQAHKAAHLGDVVTVVPRIHTPKRRNDDGRYDWS